LIDLVLEENGFFRATDALKIIKTPFFPISHRSGKNYKFSFILGLGSNINPKIKLNRLIFRLLKDRRIFLVATSPILINRAFGYKPQPDFYNAVALIKSDKSPAEMLKIAQHYEKIFGRKRSFKNAPRTLDIDILYADAKARKSQRLILPHPGANSRISVILPLGLMGEK